MVMHPDSNCGAGNPSPPSYQDEFKETGRTRTTGTRTLKELGWASMPENPQMSFMIPEGFEVTLREGGDSNAFHKMTGDGLCHVCDFSNLNWNPTAVSEVNIERTWMVEFFETEDCSSEASL